VVLPRVAARTLLHQAARHHQWSPSTAIESFRRHRHRRHQHRVKHLQDPIRRRHHLRVAMTKTRMSTGFATIARVAYRGPATAITSGTRRTKHQARAVALSALPTGLPGALRKPLPGSLPAEVLPALPGSRRATHRLGRLVWTTHLCGIRDACGAASLDASSARSATGPTHSRSKAMTTMSILSTTVGDSGWTRGTARKSVSSSGTPALTNGFFLGVLHV
jgi:hypothetical protein